MDRRLRNRIVIFLVLAAGVAIVLVRLSGRQPVAKISAVTPVRENLVSSISSNGKVEPIAPYVVRAQLDTFIEKISGAEGGRAGDGRRATRSAAAKSRCAGAADRAASGHEGRACGQ